MPSAGRRQYIDWARGFAVLVMMEAHTLDAWTRTADRSSRAYAYAIIVGGFAAPLFLWLAGLNIVLAGVRTTDRRAAATAIVSRGLEIFILAFLFRIQAFIVSPGSHPITLLRVDILNVMGPSIAAAGVVWALAPGNISRTVWYAILASLISLATPIVRHSGLVDSLPTLIQWYVRPAGEHTPFTLFPWMGFVFAGAATGGVIAEVVDRPTDLLRHISIGAAGAALIVLGLFAAARPTIYAVSSFWTSSPTWFFIRVGVMMMVFGFVWWALSIRRWPMLAEPIATLGRASLFVYWIHVDLVYGYASYFWWRGIPLWGVALSYLAFAGLIYYAVILKNHTASRLASKFRPRPALSEA